MGRIIRFYNQNRLAFWIMVLIIVFFIVILQVINNIVKENSRKKHEEISNTNTIQNTVVENVNHKQPIISGDDLKDSSKTNYSEVLEKFSNYCVNGNYSEAYKLLSKKCKENLYRTEEDFIDIYCKDKFSDGMKFDYELWSSSGNVVYRIKISEDMLATGKANSKSYIEDYYTVVSEDDELKLNINSYINSKQLNIEKTLNNLTIIVEKVDCYKDNYIFTFKLKNENNYKIILDTRERTDTTYLTNNKDKQYIALLYENIKQDLIINPKEEKQIKIKFNVINANEAKINKIVFSDITFIENNEEIKEKLEIEL